MDERDRERRKFTRFHFEGNAILRTINTGPGRKGEGQPVSLVDLSLKGVLLRGNETFLSGMPQGSLAHLTIKLSKNGPEIDMQLRLAHHHHNCAGFVCELIDVDSMSHLRRLAELNTGQPDLLDRELMQLSQ